MRKIKFRAWAKGSKEMYYSNFKINPDGKIETYGIYDYLELMQFTGLHDKNGKEIWEGDIVNLSFTNGIIDYVPPQFMISCKNNIGEIHHFNFERTMDVIGNIYENPELLEGK